MIKRVFASLMLLSCFCITAMANQELSIKLDNKNRVHSEQLEYLILRFEYLFNSGNNARVKVSVENIVQDPLALLVFRRDTDEKKLKKNKPKIEFEKKYPGMREVKGCRVADYKSFDIITAAKTDTLFVIDVALTSPKDLELPLYIAKYKPRDLEKKGEYGIKYKILEERLYDIHIEVKGWSEEDPIYVSIKNSVEQFILSLEDVEFCSNKKHREEQQRPYQERRDSLINSISSIKESYMWISTDAPHIAYTKLETDLNNVNLDTHISDCGKHKVQKRGHICSYCSLSAQNLYHRLDDMYQQLHTGKTAKEQALKSARAINNCYLQCKRRKKDSFYGSKISEFYNRIANY